MGFIDSLFKPKPSILTDDDKNELKEIRRKAYMDEARKLAEIKGKEMAKFELGMKQKKEDF
jgi:DNA-binding protein YbaB